MLASGRLARLSLSSVIADLTARGPAHLDEPAAIVTDPRSGFPVVAAHPDVVVLIPPLAH